MFSRNEKIQMIRTLQSEMWTQQSECEDCPGDCDWCARYNILEEIISDIAAMDDMKRT